MNCKKSLGGGRKNLLGTSAKGYVEAGITSFTSAGPADSVAVP